MADKSQNKKIDLITMYLINNLFYSLVDEMSAAVIRTSFSPLSRDAFDFQCGIFKADGTLILEGEGSILHSLAYTYIIKLIHETYEDDIHPGDIFINNDPYSEASHLPDIYMLEPVFLEDQLIAWVTSGGHQVDVGGRVAGSCACDSTEIYQEGLRIPNVKFCEKGKPNRAVFDLIKANSRVPDIIIGDLESHHAACHTGKKRLFEMISTYGWDSLESYIDALVDHAEQRTREEIKALPDGTYEFTDYLDDDGFVDKLVPIHLKITIKDDEIMYDFTGTAPQIKGSMNNPVGTTRAMILIGLRCMIDPEIPRNSGVWRPVKMIIPEGCFLNPKLPGAVAGRGATLSRLMDTLMGAEAQILPSKMPACESGADWLFSVGYQDKKTGYSVFTETVWGGWGGRPSADGVNFNTPIFLDGSNQCCEENERIFPYIMYNNYGFIPDSEGAGKFHGSFALQRELTFLGEEEGTLQMRTERQRTQPWGTQGGQPGAFSKIVLNRGSSEYVMKKETIPIKQGDVIKIKTSGAGGWGNPLSRDIELVKSDVEKELISLKRAKDVYGVVIDSQTREVDIEATIKLRDSMTV